MASGTIKFFDSRKGFGFIKPDDGGPDVFLSVTQLPPGVKTLPPDQRCSYTPQDGKKGKGPAAKEFSLL